MTSAYQDPFEFEVNPKPRKRTVEPCKPPSKLAPMLPSMKTTLMCLLAAFVGAFVAALLLSLPIHFHFLPSALRYRVWTEKESRGSGRTIFTILRYDRLTGDIETWNDGPGCWQKDASK